MSLVTPFQVNLSSVIRNFFRMMLKLDFPFQKMVMWGRLMDKTIVKKISPCKNKDLFRYLAEAVRFELTEDSHPRRFSRPVH